jgi:WD40 repeat protein
MLRTGQHNLFASCGDADSYCHVYHSLTLKKLASFDCMVRPLEVHHPHNVPKGVVTLTAALATSPTSVTSASGIWACERCTFHNDSSATKCKTCLTPAPPSAPAPTAPRNFWACERCTFHNELSATKCKTCSTPAPVISAAPSTTTTSAPSATWECTRCTFQNAASVPKCAMCEFPNPNSVELGQQSGGSVTHVVAFDAAMNGPAPPPLPAMSRRRSDGAPERKSAGRDSVQNFQKVLCLDTHGHFMAAGCYDGLVLIFSLVDDAQPAVTSRPSAKSVAASTGTTAQSYRHALFGHFNSVYVVRLFVPDTHGAMRVVSGSADHTMRVWDLQHGACLGVIGIPQIVSTGISLGMRQNKEAFAGHRCELFEDQEVISDFLCGLCHNVLIKPVCIIASGCTCNAGKWFCRTCIELRHDRRMGMCPREGCKATLTEADVVDDVDMDRHVQNLIITCQRHHGPPQAQSHSPVCMWSGRVADFQQHVADAERLLHCAGGHSDWVQDLVVIAPHYLASCSFDRTVRLYGLTPSYPCLHVFHGHTDGVWSLTAATLPSMELEMSGGSHERVHLPEQHLLISGSTDSTVRVWSIDSLTCVRILSHHSADVYSLCARVFVDYSDATQRMGRAVLEIASSSADSSVCIWKFIVPAVLDLGEMTDTSAATFAQFESVYRPLLETNLAKASVSLSSSSPSSSSMLSSSTAVSGASLSLDHDASHFALTDIAPSAGYYSRQSVAAYFRQANTSTSDVSTTHTGGMDVLGASEVAFGDALVTCFQQTADLQQRKRGSKHLGVNPDDSSSSTELPLIFVTQTEATRIWTALRSQV